MENSEINSTRRRFLGVETGFVAGAGVVGPAVPFVGSSKPSAKARAIDASQSKYRKNRTRGNGNHGMAGQAGIFAETYGGQSKDFIGDRTLESAS